MSTIDYFLLYLSDDDFNTFTINGDRIYPSDLPLSISSLDENTAYKGKVKAVDTLGRISPFSEVFNVTTLQNIPYYNNLFFLYYFNDNSNDESSNNYDGSLVGSASYDNNTLLIGDNNNDSFSIPYQSIDNYDSEWTFVIRAKINNFTSSTNTFFSGFRNSPATIDFSFRCNNLGGGNHTGTLAINGSNFVMTILSGDMNIIEDLNYHTFAISRSLSVLGVVTYKAYIDGVLVRTSTNSGNNILNIDSDQFFVGQLRNTVSTFSSNNQFSGNIDYFGWWDKELSNQDIIDINTYITNI